MTESFKTLEWTGASLRLLDQRVLPAAECHVDCTTAEEVVAAMQQMVVRGAPAIGITAAYGAALSAAFHAHGSRSSGAELHRVMRDDLSKLRHARPTAVNLAWAIDRCEQELVRLGESSAPEVATALLALAVRLHAEDIATNRSIGQHGASLVPQTATILTHCNAGALATAGHGTALGVIRAAREAGKSVKVVADETRPFLQGARLTAWELLKDGFDVTVISDGAAASLLREGTVDLIIVGADRIAANGDTANKVGTYPLAVVAREHEVPFYVAAPTSTVDLSLADGSTIPIEERPAAEVLECFGVRVAPQGVRVRNPAFDITPARFITALITERGIIRAPFEPGLRAACSRA